MKRIFWHQKGVEIVECILVWRLMVLEIRAWRVGKDLETVTMESRIEIGRLYHSLVTYTITNHSIQTILLVPYSIPYF